MSFDHTKSSLGKQRLVEVGADEIWTDFLEQINDLMIEEKAARQISDHNKLAEICVRIVSITIPYFVLTKFLMIFSFNYLLTTRSGLS